MRNQQGWTPIDQIHLPLRGPETAEQPPIPEFLVSAHSEGVGEQMRRTETTPLQGLNRGTT